MIWPHFRAPLAAVLASAALAACAPDLGSRPEPSQPSAYDTTRSFTAPSAPWPTEQWWTAYGDPQLNALITEAIAGSPDLKIAEARMRQAEAVAEQTGAERWPTLTADAQVGPLRQSLNQGFQPQFRSFLPHGWHTQGRLNANLEYELDLFGKNRAAFAAARSDERAATMDMAAAYLALSTSVASAYADLVRLGADHAAAVDAVHVRQETAALVAARARESLENQGQVSLSESEVAGAQAEVDAIDGLIAMTRNQLAALLGKGPDRGLDITLPANAQVTPAGLPPSLAVDLIGRRPDIAIGRRPDIAAARLRAEAAAKRIDVAQADFYPNIDITGLIGLQALDTKDLFQHASLMGQIAPAVHLPIFDGGKISGRYRAARADYDEAVAAYDKTVTGALREVADAIANQRTLNQQLAHARTALTASENAYRIAGLRYRGGLSRYVEVLTAEDTTLSQRRNVADLEALAFSQNVALVRALGGGFVASACSEKGETGFPVGTCSKDLN
ncbi:MAG: efflux transporter outer membrane subunit [Rhodospirillaceae bacterium]|nr:MAG: efflux transporter outer membrane subunit [Rhodospirillaceae bacterium]